MGEACVLRRRSRRGMQARENPKRRAREASKALKLPAMGTKAQQALVSQRETMKRESARARSQRRTDEAEAQAEASRTLIAICGNPYIEAVSVSLETDTAVYCAARQQPISALLVFDMCISNSMRRPVSFVVSSPEGRSRGSSSDSFHEGTSACWLQSSLKPACQIICLWGYYLSEV